MEAAAPIESRRRARRPQFDPHPRRMFPMMPEYRGRFAPSPTGRLHFGSLVAALGSWLFARAAGGEWLVRIEDLDREREVAGAARDILATLAAFGMASDEPVLVQSERTAIYADALQRLEADGHAYRCWCSQERLAEMREQQRAEKLLTGYDRLCLGKSEEERKALGGTTDTPVVRMLIPDDVPLTFTDVIRGEVSAPRPDDQTRRFNDPLHIFARYQRAQARNPQAPRERKLAELDRRALETLGFTAHAQSIEIKKAYKALVKIHHPDANGGDKSSEDRLRAIIAAYTHLKTKGFV